MHVDNIFGKRSVCKHQFLELCIHDYFYNHRREREEGEGEEERWLSSEWRQQQNWNTM